MNKTFLIFGILISLGNFLSAQTTEQLAWVGVGIEDTSGKAVQNITPGILSLEINKKQQPIEQVQYVAQRQVVVLLDLVLNSPEGINAARSSAWEYLSSLNPGDVAAIAAIGQGQDPQLLCSFTSDPVQWAFALNHLDAKNTERDAAGFRFSEDAKQRLGEAFNPNVPVTPSVTGKISNDKVQELTTKFTQNLVRFSNSLGVIRGKKQVLLFTPGFPDRKMQIDEDTSIPEDRGLMMDTEEGDADVHEIPQTKREESAGDTIAHNLITSNCTVFAFNTSSYGQPITSGKDFVKRIGDKTHGSYFDNLQEGVKALKQTRGDQFLLSWKNSSPISNTVNLSVKAQSPFKVIAPNEILLPKPIGKFDPMELKLYLAHSIFGVPAPENPYFNVLLDSFPLDKEITKSVVFVNIPGEHIMEIKEKRRSFYIASYLIDSKQSLVDYVFTPVRVDAEKSSENLKKGGVRYFDSFLSSSGDYTVRGVVVDIERNEATPFSVSYSVPKFDDFIITPPIIAASNMNWVTIKHNYANDTKRKFAVAYPYEVAQGVFFPDPNATIVNGADHYLHLRVYNLSLDKAKKPAPQLHFTLTPESGKEVTISDIQIADRVQLSDNDYALLFRFKVPGVPPGNFKLNAQVSDLLAKKSAIAQRAIIVR